MVNTAANCPWSTAKKADPENVQRGLADRRLGGAQ